jgi:hypothetical protein
LAGGDLLGEPEVEELLVPGQPALVGAIPGDHGAQLVHLEPVSGAVIVADVTRCFRQVDLLRSCQPAEKRQYYRWVLRKGETQQGRNEEARKTCRDGTRVIDAKVQVKVESDDIFTGGDLSRLGLLAVVPGALVAPEVIAVEDLRSPRGLEAVVMFTDVLIRAGLDSIEHQVREEEVGGGELGKQGERRRGKG